MKVPIDCHQCEHTKQNLKEFDVICEIINKSVLDYDDKRHPDCPLTQQTKQDKQRIADLEKALAQMQFAYINKDNDCPHGFETSALETANRLLEGKNMEGLLRE